MKWRTDQSLYFHKSEGWQSVGDLVEGLLPTFWKARPHVCVVRTMKAYEDHDNHTIVHAYTLIIVHA